MGEPFTAHCFRVDILLPDSREPLCDAAFAECDGLELRLEVRSVREGGNNTGPVLFAGGASYGQVTLRRGMTSSLDLWDWCGAVLADPALRADALVTVLAPDLETVRARFRLRGCLPVRLKAPRLDALDGSVAIEELQLACEGLRVEAPDDDRPPAPPDRVHKAELHELEGPDAGRIVRVQFNPAGLRVVTAEQARRLHLELWFEAPDGDVRELTQRVASLADPPPRPVRLEWGTFRFDGRVESLEESFELFSADGRPLRARLALVLRA